MAQGLVYGDRPNDVLVTHRFGRVGACCIWTLGFFISLQVDLFIVNLLVTPGFHIGRLRRCGDAAADAAPLIGPEMRRERRRRVA
jgi:hypothetical protein